MGLALGLAVGVGPAPAAGALRAIRGAASFAAEDSAAVLAAVLPGDQHPLRARLVDRPRVFRCHFGSLGLLLKESILLLRCYEN